MEEVELEEEVEVELAGELELELAGDLADELLLVQMEAPAGHRDGSAVHTPEGSRRRLW